jgi:hypothetical protein
VSAYHAAALHELFAPVTDALEQLARGEIDPFEVDAVIFQYSRAAKDLWKHCSASGQEARAAIAAYARSGRSGKRCCRRSTSVKPASARCCARTSTGQR